MSPTTATTLQCNLFSDLQQQQLCNATVNALNAIQAQVTASQDSFTMLQADSNSFFLIWASSLVFFMHAGFATLSAGAVRSKNVKNILLCITLDLCVCMMAWFFTGFGFAFGADNGNGFIGTTFFVGLDVGTAGYSQASQQAGQGVSFAFWLFEAAFAATSATIVSGAVAERARFESYLVYSAFLSMWVYPVIVHWIWGGGFLTLNSPYAINDKLGALDFAGDGPVHMIGGLAGAIASKIIGPRMGRFDKSDGTPLPMPGHSSALANLGIFILWIGWLGFNPGSVVNYTNGDGNYAARAAVNTMLASAAGTLSALFYGYWYYPLWVFDFGVAMNGALAGLVAITAPCAFVEMWAAIVIGLTAGLVYVWASRFVLHTLKIDDPLDATPVHLFCGIWGLLCVGAFANPTHVGFFMGNPNNTRGGFLYPGAGGDLLAGQIVEIVVVCTWTAGFVTPLFYVLQHWGVLRVPPDVEEEGLDASTHGGGAYPDMFHASEFVNEKKVNQPTPQATTTQQQQQQPDGNGSSTQAGVDKALNAV